MPIKKYKKKKFYKRNNAVKKYKKYKKSGPTTSIQRSPLIIADRTFAKLKYNEIATLSSATYEGSYVFSGNGCYDPNISSTGTQPSGFDQYTNFYKEYRVRASKITVRFSGVSNTAPVILGIVPCIDYTTVAAGGLNMALRDPRARKCMISSNGQTIGLCGNYQTTKKAFGENDISDVLYVGATGNLGTGSNPTNQWYWLIDAANVTGVGSISLQLYVEVTYYVEFFKRNDNTLS